MTLGAGLGGEMMRLVAALMGLALAAAGDSVHAQDEPVQPSRQIPVGMDRFLEYQIPTADGPMVSYYISRPPDRLPLLIYIQGSGCTPAFLEMQPGQFASTIFSLTTTAMKREFAVMVVDKPYADRGRPLGGVATGCSNEFNAYFTVENWVSHIERAVAQARRLPWVDSDRILLIGLSEGATVAAALAARNAAITDVALVGASGPTQLYDMIALAYASTDEQTEKAAAVAAVEGQLREILANPESSTRFAWGHPYKRWASFMASSSVENLRRSSARVYMVSGMADQSVPISSTEVLYSELLVRNRDVQFRRIPDAGHDLLPVDADFSASMPRLEAEFARITEWFWQSGADVSASQP